MPNNEIVNLLWSGGWDSTFRLCDLLLVQGRRVRLYYVIDPGRKSVAQEINAMQRIRKRLQERIASFNTRLLSMQVVWLWEIAPESSMTSRYESLRRRFKSFGPQYEWLGRFVAEQGIGDLELSIESNSFRPNGPLWSALESMLVEEDANFRLCDNPSDSDFEFFRSFRFPLIRTTKLEMMSYAKEHGFDDIMLQSWFCHTPRNGRPCGVCHPCHFALTEGMSRRVPLSGKVRYILRRMGIKLR